MEVGKRYAVTANDCCLTIDFIAILVGIGNDEDSWPSEYTVWSNGVTVRGGVGWTEA